MDRPSETKLNELNSDTYFATQLLVQEPALYEYEELDLMETESITCIL